MKTHPSTAFDKAYYALRNSCINLLKERENKTIDFSIFYDKDTDLDERPRVVITNRYDETCFYYVTSVTLKKIGKDDKIFINTEDEDDIRIDFCEGWSEINVLKAIHDVVDYENFK